MNFVLLLSYLIGSITFIVGLKMLSHPDSARKGNLTAAAGMAIAIVATIFLYRDDAGEGLHNYGWIFSGLIIGTVIGTASAKKVKMTAMPEMVSLFNGMGGACAMLISIVEFGHLAHPGHMPEGVYNTVMPFGILLIILLGLLIGTVSFAGSMIAWGKLNGRIKDRNIPGGQAINFILLAGVIVLFVLLLTGNGGNPHFLFYGILALAALYGVLFVMPIGGADMPVVISLLNSFTGVAAACGGFCTTIR